MLKCEKCGTANKEEDYFCKQCGSKLAKPSLLKMSKAFDLLGEKLHKASKSLKEERKWRRKQLPIFRESLLKDLSKQLEKLKKIMSEGQADLRKRTASKESLKKISNAFESRQRDLLKEVRGLKKVSQTIEKAASTKEVDELKEKTEKLVSKKIDKISELFKSYRKRSARSKDIELLRQKFSDKIGKLAKNFEAMTAEQKELYGKHKNLGATIKKRMKEISQLIVSIQEPSAKQLAKFEEKIGKSTEDTANKLDKKFESIAAKQMKLRARHEKFIEKFRKVLGRLKYLGKKIERLEELPVEEIKIKEVPLKEAGKPAGKKRCLECKTLN